MYKLSPNPAVILLSTLLFAVAAVACSEDSTAPGEQAGFLDVSAWACPDIAVRNLTFTRCVREGESFDPTVADLPGRLSVLILLVRADGPGMTHRIVARIIQNGVLIDGRVFPPMGEHDGRPDVLTDTVSILPLPDQNFDVILEVAVGERIPFLTLVADTTFHWE